MRGDKVGVLRAPASTTECRSDKHKLIVGLEEELIVATSLRRRKAPVDDLVTASLIYFGSTSTVVKSVFS